MARPSLARFVRSGVTGGLLLVLPAAHAAAQRLPITYYSTSDGLAHYVVNRIVRDSHGFLWFCTRGGLSRFDGREFVNWGVDDGLPVGDINALIEMPDGLFWIATERGLVRFNPRGRRQSGGAPHDPGSDRMFMTYIPAGDPRTGRISAVQPDR